MKTTTLTPEQTFETSLAKLVNDAATSGANPATIYMVLGGVQMEILNSLKRRAAGPETNNEQPTPPNVEPLRQPDSAN